MSSEPIHYSVQVFNVAGSEVWWQMGIAAGTRVVDINTSGLGAGVYSLVLTDEKGGVTVEKFVEE
jgi:hypothetical protein